MGGELRIPIGPRAIAYHILDHTLVRQTRTENTDLLKVHLIERVERTG